METTAKKVKVWSIDPTHSSIHFSVKHMVIATAKGSFGKYKVNVETDGLDFENAKIEMEIDVDSISTSTTDRDNHLRSADFFDAEKYPVIAFKSTEFIKISDENYKLLGNITVKGTTKPIEFNVEFGGQLTDPWGNIRAGFNIKGAIDRFDFGLNWNSLLETGNAMVGKTVKLEAEIEIVTPK